MKCSRTLTFSPLSWAKICWITGKAGKMEISGFGVSAADDPFSVVDFFTVKQECDSTETKMDNNDLTAYMTRMAKAGIDPCRCMRIWIHSHPFATGKPGPSPQDNVTLEDKTGRDSHWAIMVIVGSEGIEKTFARLQIRDDLLEEPILLGLDCEIDWGLLANQTIITAWEKEYKRNIHKAPVIAVHQDKGNKKGKRQLYSSASPRSYREEWEHFGFIPGGLDEDNYVLARIRGFTIREILEWGDWTLEYMPEELALLQGAVDKETAKETSQIRQAHNRQERNKPCNQKKQTRPIKPMKAASSKANENKKNKESKGKLWNKPRILPRQRGR